MEDGYKGNPADYVTLGNFVLHDHTLTKRVRALEIGNIGEEFAQYYDCWDFMSVRHLCKDMLFGERPWMVMGFCAYKRLSSSKVWYRTKDVQFSLQMYWRDSIEEHGIPLLVAEALKKVESVIVIDDFISRYPNTGFRALSEAVNAHSEESFLVSVHPGLCGDIVMCQQGDDYSGVIQSLEKRFCDIGFVRATDYIGEADGEPTLVHMSEDNFAKLASL